MLKHRLSRRDTERSADTEDRRITVDAFRMAGMSLFDLILSLNKLLQTYGLPSTQFISAVFSSKSKCEQMDHIIAAMKQVRQEEKMNSKREDNEIQSGFQ